MKALTAAQVEAYRHDGFLFPFPALDEGERLACLAGLERYERWLGTPVPRAENKWRTQPHALLPWYADLVRHPRILDVVEDLIGPDILVWTGTFFIKEAQSPTFAAWHQDSTYFGLEPYEQVTAWVALTDASREAGCMEVLSAHGVLRQMYHSALRLENSINRAGQTITEPLHERGAVTMQLTAGSFSLHHTLCVHRSAPNRAAHRRIGCGINYIPAHVRPTGPVRMAAMLVRGRDRWGHFDLYDPPTVEFDTARHADVFERYSENYRAQVERHERQFAPEKA
ncbi:phytanoyl-CoA dioxygenase family protein [Reyranella sp.]|uniref:phytanoyl-CoA dioxygenase family protein n=1 Tax=Reyranella sp. TaxID=1929291 RepID=UPI0037846C2E